MLHHFFTVIYAFVFSFCHAGAVHKTEARLQPPTRAVYLYAPTLRNGARSDYASSYAETTCVSCRQSNISYNER